MKGFYLLCLWTFMSKDMMAGCNHSSCFLTMKGTKLKQSKKMDRTCALSGAATAKLMDRGAWRAAVHGAAKSRTRLSSHTGCSRGSTLPQSFLLDEINPFAA